MRRRLLALFLLLPAGGARAQSTAPVAGSVVRSKEWIVRRGKSREEEFVGDVRYEAAGTKLTSDWALYRQGPADWRVRGHITARREFPAGDVVETVGEKAWYDENTLKGRLEPPAGGRVPVLHTPLKGDPDHAAGDHLTWIGENVGVLSGHTLGWGPRGEFWADTSRYERASSTSTRILILNGARPVMHNFQGGDDAAVMADRIVGTETPRRAVATGRTIGWIVALSSAMPKTGPVALRCGQGSDSEGPGPDARVTALLAPLGPGRTAEEEARFWQAKDAAYASHACPWGAVYDFWADQADLEQVPERRVTLTGGRPVLRKIEDDSSSALKADRIVGFAAARRIVATGKVRGWMVFKEEKKHKGKKEKKKGEKTK